MASNAAVLGGLRLWTRYGLRFLNLGNCLFVSRWEDVTDVLRRDGDFIIAPVNRQPIDDVAGHFMLGMDRSPQLFHQRQAEYTALRAIDMTAVDQVLQAQTVALLASAVPGGRIDAVEGYARPIAARIAACMTGVSSPGDAALAATARLIFDAAFLNLFNDPVIQARGRAAGDTLRGWILAEQRGRAGKPHAADLLGQLMAQIPPPPPGPKRPYLTQAQKELQRDIPALIAGNIVGLIDQIVMAVTYIIGEILSNAALHANVMADIDHPRRLAGWCLEAWRCAPNAPALRRVAVEGATIAGRPVKAGKCVLVLTSAAMQDGRVFTEPQRLKPDRDPAQYLHFGYGIHACAGRNIAGTIIPSMVAAVMRCHPRGCGRLIKDGQFPKRLIVNF